MGKIESVEREIEKFSADELAVFRSWFAEFDALAWDEQFERDVTSGRLDKFADEALAGKLLLSLDEYTPSEVERLWLDEAERRLEAYRAGRAEGIPGDEVFRRAISELS